MPSTIQRLSTMQMAIDTSALIGLIDSSEEMMVSADIPIEGCRCCDATRSGWIDLIDPATF
jgi:hypothetical protein